MTRKAQTLSIVGAIFAAVAIYIGYDTVTNPNLDGLNDTEKCSYWAYYKNHGGDPGQCRLTEAKAAAVRISGAPDPDLLTAADMNATMPDVPPTKY